MSRQRLDATMAAVLTRLRLRVPDRPGSLGVVAAAIGAAGGDIVALEVLESEAGRALDDVYVEVTGPGGLQRLRAHLSAVPGVDVAGVQQPAPPVTGHAELELVAALVAAPGRAVQTLVDGAPGACGSDWAVVLGVPEAPTGAPRYEVLTTSPRCPGAEHVVVTSPPRLGAVPLGPEGSHAADVAAAMVPMPGSDTVLLLVRDHGPAFHPGEVWRLDQVGRVAGLLTGVPAA